MLRFWFKRTLCLVEPSIKHNEGNMDATVVVMRERQPVFDEGDWPLRQRWEILKKQS